MNGESFVSIISHYIFWSHLCLGLNERGVIRSREESLMCRGECSGSHSCLGASVRESLLPR